MANKSSDFIGQQQLKYRPPKTMSALSKETIKKLTPDELAEMIIARSRSLNDACDLCSKAFAIIQSRAAASPSKKSQELESGAEISKPEESPRVRARSRASTLTTRSLIWSSPVHGRCSFMAYAYLVTPPAVRPRTTDESENPCYDSYVEQTNQTLELLIEPQRDVNLLCQIMDRYGEYRGCIADDGQCFNNLGVCIGFVNIEDNIAGSSEEEYLGCVKDQLSGDEVCIEDAMDEISATFNLGRSTLLDYSGSTVAEIMRDGTIQSSMGSTLGQFEPFSYNDVRVYLLYLVLIDPSMLSRREYVVDT